MVLEFDGSFGELDPSTWEPKCLFLHIKLSQNMGKRTFRKIKERILISSPQRTGK